MSVPITLTNVIPPPREDGKKYVSVIVKESSAQAGPFTTVYTEVLSPVEPDPTKPIERGFTFPSLLEAGWYGVIFVDQDGNQLTMTHPVHIFAPPDVLWRPGLKQVADTIISRTVDGTGATLDHFSNSTRPTAAEATAQVDAAVIDVSASIGNVIPSSVLPYASRLTAIRAAILIELNFFPEQVGGNDRSPYTELLRMYEAQLALTVERIQQAEAVAGTDDTTQSPGMAQFAFPSNDQNGLVGWNTIW